MLERGSGMNWLRTLLATLFAVLLAAVTTTYAAKYVLTPLLSPLPRSSTAKSINNSGSVAGSALFKAFSTSSNRAFVYRNYTTTFLSGPDGPSYATAINESGQVAGYGPVDGHQHAVLWTNGIPLDLGVLDGTTDSYAYGVNDFGIVVGNSYTIPGNYHYPFIWQGGVMTRLGTATTSEAYSINSSGVVAGMGDNLPVTWDTSGNMTTLATGYGVAYQINDAGQVVGRYQKNGYNQGFLCQDGRLQDLPTPAGAVGTYAFSINSSGLIVGHGYYSPAPYSYRALLWENGAVSDLNTLIPPGSGWVLEWAYDINAAGQIVGRGVYNGQAQAFLLTPTVAPVTQVTVDGTAGCGGWYASPVTVTLAATDNSGSGIKEIRYSLDGGSEVVIGDVTAAVAISGDGAHTLQYHAGDNAGNVEASNSLAVNIDGTLPSSTASVSGAAGSNGWYISPVTVQINGTDATSGVGSIKYRKNTGGNWGSTVTTGNPALVTFGNISTGGNGRFSVGFRSVDRACNAETENFVDINIDRTPPISTYATSILPNANDWYTGDITATFTATDNLSGVASLSVNGAGVAGSVASYPLAEGNNSFNFFATDNAGLAEGAKSAAFQVDKTPPVTSYSTSATANANGWFSTDSTVNFSASDNLSGVDFLTINGTNYPGFTASAVVGEGVSTLEYSATDKAGATEGVRTATFSVDKTPPAVTVSTLPATLAATKKTKLVPVAINGSATDSLSGIATIVITVSDEYGSYNMTVPSFGATVYLDTYKKRKDVDGRLYTIKATATDLVGNQQTAIYSLWVK